MLNSRAEVVYILLQFFFLSPSLVCRGHFCDPWPDGYSPPGGEAGEGLKKGGGPGHWLPPPSPHWLQPEQAPGGKEGLGVRVTWQNIATVSNPAALFGTWNTLLAILSGIHLLAGAFCLLSVVTFRSGQTRRAEPGLAWQEPECNKVPQAWQMGLEPPLCCILAAHLGQVTACPGVFSRLSQWGASRVPHNTVTGGMR